MKKLNQRLLKGFLFMMLFAVAGLTPALAIGGLAHFAQKMAPKVTITQLYTSVDVSALATYAGDYEKQLFSTMVNGLDVASDIRVMPNIKNKLNLTKLTAKANAKPFSTTEEYQGNLAYTPRVIEVKQGKVEMLIDLEDYRNEWMADQMGPGSHANKNAQSIPFAPYTWGEVLKSLGAEINDRTVYHGFDSSATVVYNNDNHPYSAGDRVFEVVNGVKNFYEATATTASTENPSGTPGKWKLVNAEAIAKGFKEILTEEITGSNISAVTTGAVATGAEALEAQRELFRSLPESYKKMGVTIFQSYTDYELLMDGIEDKITKYTKADNTPLYLPGTDNKCIVKPATWMTDTRRMIATPANNLIMGTDLLSDMNNIKVLENAKLWTMPVGIKFGAGFQIRDLEALAINDQD